MNGRLSIAQEAAVAPYIHGQRVLDLGASDLALSHVMVAMGALDVLAVDRRRMPVPQTPKIQTDVRYFHDLGKTRSVVLASWIVNWDVGIERQLHAATHVVVLSKNTDGSVCGYPGMWELLRQREVLLYLPECPNVVTVYGPQKTTRGPTGEEIAAVDLSHVYAFDEAESAAMSFETNCRVQQVPHLKGTTS